MENKMSRLGVLVCLFLLLAPCGFAAEETMPSYKLGMSVWVGWAGAKVAEVKGFWKEQGIDVKCFEFDSDRESIEAMKSGLLDFTFMMLGSVVDLYQQGEPMVILAETNWSHGGDKIVVKNGFDFKENKNSPLGVYLNQTCVTYFLDKYLQTQEVSLSDFRILEIDDTAKLAERFVDDTFSAIVAYEPDASKAISEGDGYAAATTADYEGCMPEGIIMTKDALDKFPEEDLVKFFKGYVKAADWLNDPANWDEYSELLNQHVLYDEDYSKEEIKEMVNEVIVHTSASLKERNSLDGGIATYLDDVRKFLKSNDKLKKDFKASDLVDTSALLKAF